MKTTMLRRSLRAGLLALLVFACDSEDPLGPLAILTNTWRNAANENHTFNMQDDTGFQPKRSGTFTGTETTPAGAEFDLEGYWRENGTIQFTVHRATDVTYSGTLTSNPDRIDFTSSAGPLTLIRN